MVWLIVATLAASFIKGVCGFANTLVFTTILSFSFNNIQITPMDLIIGYPANVIIAWKERRQINWRISLPVAALIIFGNIPGIFMLKNVDTRTIKVIFGLSFFFLLLVLLCYIHSVHCFCNDATIILSCCFGYYI